MTTTTMSFRELARQWRAVMGASGVRLECADDLEQLCDAWEQEEALECAGETPMNKLTHVPNSADVERLVEALRKYGRHLPTCKFREWECSQPGCGETHCYACTCGWDIVLFNQPVAPTKEKP